MTNQCESCDSLAWIRTLNSGVISESSLSMIGQSLYTGNTEKQHGSGSPVWDHVAFMVKHLENMEAGWLWTAELVSSCPCFAEHLWARRYNHMQF